MCIYLLSTFLVDLRLHRSEDVVILIRYTQKDKSAEEFETNMYLYLLKLLNNYIPRISMSNCSIFEIRTYFINVTLLSIQLH